MATTKYLRFSQITLRNFLSAYNSNSINSVKLRHYCALQFVKHLRNRSMWHSYSKVNLLSVPNVTYKISSLNKSANVLNENRLFDNEKQSGKRKLRESLNAVYDLLEELSSKTSWCLDDWRQLTEFVLSQGRFMAVNETNVETFIMKSMTHLKLFNLGKAYFTYVKNKNQNVNIVTLSWYLRLNYICWDQHVEDDTVLVQAICDEIMSKMPFIDSKIVEDLILGLCLTDWKKTLKVLGELSESCTISALSRHAISKAAFENGDTDAGWSFLEDSATKGFNIDENIYTIWLNVCKSKKVATSKLFNFFSRYNVIPNDAFGEQLVNLLRGYTPIASSELKPAVTSVSKHGICMNCNSKLPSGALTESEFDKLRLSFLNPVLVGKDVFLKSTPEELQRFQEFVKTTAPYDYVLDGLNIAYAVGVRTHTSQDFSKKLKIVVKYFVDRGEKVLVLGRKHMRHWSKNDIGYIEKHAHLFLADNVSVDDAFIIYAALYSGVGTKLVTRDMLRGHKYLLSEFDPQLQSLFWRWQQQHQYFLVYIQDNGHVILKPPVRYLEKAHQLKGRWHVPCTQTNLPPDTPGHKKFTLKTWLCVPSLS